MHPQHVLHLVCNCVQSERHEREVRLLADGLEDPAREAEVRLLRDDCRYLKVRGCR